MAALVLRAEVVTGIAPELIGDARDVLALAAAICLAWWARGPVVAVVLWVAGRRGRRDAASWWSNRNLTTALVQADVLKAREGERLNLSYRGAPRHNDTGTTVTVALPQAQALTGVLAHRESLAAALHIPVSRLEVTQADDDPANVVTFRVGTGVQPEVAATVTSAARTSWTDPVRIGADTHGQPVELATVEANTLIAGHPGAGKTSLARIILGHYLLDSATTVYVLDGKGSRRDYGAARPLCTRFVSGVDEDAVPDTLAMLGEVLEIVRARNASGDLDHPGLLLLLEEYQDIRAAASKAQREQLDVCLGRIIRQGRAVSVHLKVSTQRPSVDDLPSGTRNLVSQRLALMLWNGQDARLVLGHTPTLPMPTRRGQALLTTPAGTRAVLLDRLTEDAWRALCARATALRGTNTPGPIPTLTLTKPAQGILETPTDILLCSSPLTRDLPVPARLATDPLLEAVLDVLADADPAGIPATELHAALPDWHGYVPTPQALGAELRRHPTEVERVYRGSSRVWRLSERCRSSVGEVSVGVGGPRYEVSVPTLTDTQKGPVRAQVGASDSAGVKAARAGVDR